MLEIKKITKVYKTGGFTQKALDEVSVNFRKNEFASILGPSGSGKTTLLNIIGGLDHYDNGDLIINEISTKKYKDRDWDTYRNHRVGFVFQSYNLISHQSILSNVELALTLSGIAKKERIKRAKEALKKVGLEKHIHKRPSELSGGQMQRVAIARALVNDPEILLADEPTGALDSDTSIEVMNILKEVAKDKLVIMVTHNPDLAKDYSTRIITLKDGKITGDTNPYNGKENTSLDKMKEKENTKKTSMNLKTALSLSLNNLMTKKGRTFLTAFAGSIGIIGIALILSLSNGVEEYIDRVERETLSSYPLSIESSTIDYTKMMENFQNTNSEKCEKDNICTTDDISSSPYLTFTSSLVSNNLEEFKKYLEDNKNIKDYVTDIQYTYDLSLQIYSKNSHDEIVKVNPNKNNYSMSNMSSSININPSEMGLTSLLSNSFRELIDSEELFNSQYEIVSGKMPKEYNEMILIVDENNNIPLSVMYSLDIENREELSDIVNKIKNKEEVNIDSINYDYDSLLENNYKLILNTSLYTKNNNIWIDNSNDSTFLEDIYNKGLDLKIVGIAKVKSDSSYATSGYIGYNKSLKEYVINEINNEEITKEQLSNKDINVLTGKKFDGMTSSYENNLSTLGIVDINSPKTINIYPKDFESKENIENIIKEYNDSKDEEDKIKYTDMVGVLLSGVTTIVDVISYILIAFVAISLVVSSIMIAIITYISVLERTKEIGILRAIGASKKDITRVFNAETIIEGFVSGVLGILVTLLLNIPINAIVNNLFEVKTIARLPLFGAIILIIISILLTLFAGLIPSRLASKKDPVEALRIE